MNACVWLQESEDSDGWMTSCGEGFWLNEGTPVHNGMKFCCFCGKPLMEERWTEEPEEDLYPDGDLFPEKEADRGTLE